MISLVAGGWYVESRFGAWFIYDDRHRLMGAARTRAEAESRMVEMMP